MVVALVAALAEVQVVVTAAVQRVIADRKVLRQHAVREVQAAATEVGHQEPLPHVPAQQHVRNRLPQPVLRRQTQRQLAVARLRVVNSGKPRHRTENRCGNLNRKTAA
ncbi:hypothetical protein C6501_08700 [Candidatus Poribacteria bacterium]|nr:MAG: hypothetical protein C6501_08700 [Candidatus Poribacteria bacterium]